MKIVDSVAKYRALGLEDVGFIPTMGALHDGHLSLVEAAREHNNRVVSIFVNPLQFGPNEDFGKYPRQIERDIDLLTNAGATVVFLPSVEEMYPEGATTRIDVGAIARRWEGESRPGHFNGVATVVCKLFNIVAPTAGYFGLKDFQQCAVISQMVRDLDLPVRLVFCPTVREGSGLARSSRNEYLSNEDRDKASLIYKALVEVRKIILQNEGVNAALKVGETMLSEAGFTNDYFAYVDRSSLEPLSHVQPDSVLLVATRLGPVRLIDNLRVN